MYFHIINPIIYCQLHGTSTSKPNIARLYIWFIDDLYNWLSVYEAVCVRCVSQWNVKNVSKQNDFRIFSACSSYDGEFQSLSSNTKKWCLIKDLMIWLLWTRRHHFSVYFTETDARFLYIERGYFRKWHLLILLFLSVSIPLCPHNTHTWHGFIIKRKVFSIVSLLFTHMSSFIWDTNPLTHFRNRKFSRVKCNAINMRSACSRLAVIH